MSYGGWRTKQRLHSKEGWGGLTKWTEVVKMKNKNWSESSSINLGWITAGVFLLLLVCMGKSEANVYDFPPKDVVTMDVEMANGTSGTYTCPSARWCYIKSLEYEARGAEQYCVSLVMKRNGKVIWWRKYQ